MTSLRRTDLLALSNLRNDGRKPHEIRRMRIQMGPLSAKDVAGSSLVEMGLTVVLATVRGPMECTRRSDELADRAVLDVTVKSAPFAPSTDRRVSNPNTDRRLVEHSNLLKKAMESSVLVRLFPKSKIEIIVWVLADDGGRLCAAVNASTCALVHAGMPMRDLVCSCSAGWQNETPIIDLNRMEELGQDMTAAVYMPVACMPQRGTVVLAQCEARLPNLTVMEQVLDAGLEACRTVFDVLQAAIREYASTQLAARMGRATISSTFDS